VGRPGNADFPGLELFGLAVVGENAYWLEDGGDWPVIGVSPLSGGGQSLLEDQDGGFTTRILYIPSIGRLLSGEGFEGRPFGHPTRTRGIRSTVMPAAWARSTRS